MRCATEHRHKKSIPMNVPTHCRRQYNLYKETSGTTCRHEKQRNNMCTQRTDGNAQTEVPPLHPFLACGLVPLHKDASHKQLTTSVAFPPIMRDVSITIHHNRRRLDDVPREFPKLVQRQDTVLVPFNSTSEIADIGSFGYDAPEAQFHPHLVTNVSLVNLEDLHHQLAFRGQSIEFNSSRASGTHTSHA